MGTWLQLSLFFATLLCIPVIVAYFFADDVLALFVSDKEIVRLAGRFARLSACSLWPLLVYSSLRQYMQAQNIVLPATVVSALSVGVAVALNQTLIYGVPGAFDGLGFDGSPLATLGAALFQIGTFSLYCFAWKV